MAKDVVLDDAVKGSYHLFVFNTQCSIYIRYSSGVPSIEETADPIANGTLSILRSAALQLKSSTAGD